LFHASSVGLGLMTEMARSGQDHDNATLIGRRYHFIIAH
jgi:hypothetical protein